MVQIRPGGSTRYTQHLANLRVRKALYIMQDNYRPRTIRELFQRRLEPLPQLSTLRRIAEGGRNRFGNFLRISNLSPAGQIERRIRDDSIEPRAESLSRVEAVDRLIRPQESLLHRILRVLVRHYDRPGHYIRAPLMKTYEPGEAAFVSLPSKTYELPFLIRNTYGGVRLLRGWQWRWVGILAVRYGREGLTGVAEVRRQMVAGGSSEPVPWSHARVPS